MIVPPSSGPPLGPTDEMMLRNIRLTRSVRTVQAILLASAPITRKELNHLANRLSCSHLSRGIITPGPRWLRRPRWTPPLEHRGELRLDHRPSIDITEWLDTQVFTPLLPTIAWRLSMRPTHQGSVLSLVVPHLYSDGHGVVAALSDRSPAEHTSIRSTTTGFDTSHQVPATPPRNGVRVLTRYLSANFADIQAVTQRRGVTPTGLILHASSHAYMTVQGATCIIAGVPVSTRAETGDEVHEEANKLTVVPLSLCASDSLADTARKLHAALTNHQQMSPITVSRAVYRWLPTRIRQECKKPGTAACELLVSNFGPVTGPGRIKSLSGCAIDTIAFRTVNAPFLHRSLQHTRATVVAAGANGQLTVTVSYDPGTVSGSRLVREIGSLLQVPIRPLFDKVAVP